MTHEMRAIVHELDDFVGIAQEILAVRDGAFSIATPVRHHETKALVGERSLRLPLIGARRQRAVHEHHRRPGAPAVYEEVTHWLSSISVLSETLYSGADQATPSAFLRLAIIETLRRYSRASRGSPAAR